MCVSVGKVNCYLCSKSADIFPQGEAIAMSHIHCPICGEYIITLQAIHVLESSTDDIKYILSSQTFEKYYYEKEPFTIKSEHILNAKDIPLLEKLYKLSKYLYNETKKRGIGSKIENISNSQFYCRNTSEYIFLLDTLKSMNIIDFDKIESPSGAKGSCNYLYMSPTMLSYAMIKFEVGIHDVENFKDVFMNTKSNENQVINIIKDGNNQINQAFNNSSITANQNNSIDIKELNNLIENILSSLPQDIDNKIRDEVKENLNVIQTEIQNSNPRKTTIIKNTLTALKGLVTTTGFLASIAKLAEFIKF